MPSRGPRLNLNFVSLSRTKHSAYSLFAEFPRVDCFALKFRPAIPQIPHDLFFSRFPLTFSAYCVYLSGTIQVNYRVSPPSSSTSPVSFVPYRFSTTYELPPEFCPLTIPLFSTSSTLPNLQLLCFDNVATVPGGVGGHSPFSLFHFRSSARGTCRISIFAFRVSVGGERRADGLPRPPTHAQRNGWRLLSSTHFHELKH